MSDQEREHLALIERVTNGGNMTRGELRGWSLSNRYNC